MYLQGITCTPAYANSGNLQVSCSADNFLNSACDFSCTGDFALVGDASTLTCMEDTNLGDVNGAWSSAPPTCEGKALSSALGYRPSIFRMIARLCLVF